MSYELKLDLMTVALTALVLGLIYLWVWIQDTFFRSRSMPYVKPAWTTDRCAEASCIFSPMADSFVSAIGYCHDHLDDEVVQMHLDRAETRLRHALKYYRRGDHQAAYGRYDSAEDQLRLARAQADRLRRMAASLQHERRLLSQH